MTKLIPFLFFATLCSLHAQGKIKAPLDLTELDGKQVVAEEIYDYQTLVAEMNEIKSQKNQVRANLEIVELAKQVKGKKFLVKDTLIVKRDALVSRDYVLWFEPYEGIEMKLMINERYKDEFEKISELDFITAYARMINIDNIITMQYIQLKNIQPFNPEANFLDFNLLLSNIVKKKKDKKIINVSRMLYELRKKTSHHIGQVTGKIIKMKYEKSKYFLYTTVAGFNVKIDCLVRYAGVLADIEIGQEVSMAVYFKRFSPDGQLHFARGVPISSLLSSGK